jgi:hypothetical protein
LFKLESNDEEVIQSQEYPAHFTGRWQEHWKKSLHINNLLQKSRGMIKNMMILFWYSCSDRGQGQEYMVSGTTVSSQTIVEEWR